MAGSFSLSLCLPHLFTVQPFFLDTPFYHRFLACIAFAPAFPSLPLHLPSLPCDSPRGTFPLLLCTSCSLSHHLASRGPHVGSSVFACVSSILCIIQLVVFFSLLQPPGHPFRPLCLDRHHLCITASRGVRSRCILSLPASVSLRNINAGHLIINQPSTPQCRSAELAVRQLAVYQAVVCPMGFWDWQLLL